MKAVKIIKQLIDLIEHGGLGEAPDHVCGTPDAVCDCLCEQYANGCKLIHEAEEYVEMKETKDQSYSLGIRLGFHTGAHDKEMVTIDIGNCNTCPFAIEKGPCNLPERVRVSTSACPLSEYSVFVTRNNLKAFS